MTGDDCTVSTPVCVFPADSGILFVETDDVGACGDGAVAFGFGAVEVLRFVRYWEVLKI